jgi:hypothetical protein
MDQAAESLEGGDAGSLPPLDPLLRKMSMLPEDRFIREVRAVEVGCW